ncbi:MAG: integration host factor subunit beta [Methylococcaceae bacterium]|nr:integration host factor subunit beta [Methylococcaceae bacterium]
MRTDCRFSKKQTHLAHKDVDLAVDCIIEHMCQTLVDNNRIEIRGFGTFSLHHHPARAGRNPKTGEILNLSAKRLVHFKPGKALRDRIDDTRLEFPISNGD